MTLGRCLRLAAFVPALLLMPPWAASFVRSFDARLAGPSTAASGALYGGRLDLNLRTSSRGFPPPMFRYGIYEPRRYDPLENSDFRFAGFGFERIWRAKSQSLSVTVPPWFVPLTLLVPIGIAIRNRLRSAPTCASESDRRRIQARRFALGSLVLATLLTIFTGGIAEAFSSRRWTLDWPLAAALAANASLAAAGSAAGGLLSAPQDAPERWKAAIATAARGFIDYWFVLFGLALLTLFALMGLSLLILP